MLGHQQVLVLGVLGQVLGGGGVLLAVLEHPVDHVAVNEADRAEVLKALVGDAHALEVLGVGVLAAQLLLGGGQVLLVRGFVLAGVGVALFLALGLDHAVHGGVVLGGCFDLVSDGLVAVFVDLGVPEAGLAVVALHHAGVGVGGVGLLGQPEEVLLGGYVLAVDGEQDRGALVAHDVLHGIIVAAAAAEQAGGHDHRQRDAQAAADEMFHIRLSPLMVSEYTRQAA